MQGLVERARQALGVGPDAFLPSTLEAQEMTVKELDVFAPNLRDMIKAAQTFEGDTKGFLESSGKYITEAPLPQLWMQGSASEPAQVTQIPVPAEHAAWFDAGVAERESGIVPASVSYAFQRQVVAPMEQWLWAHQVAQGHLSELQTKRLAYDAERRKLVQRATAATSSITEHTGTVIDPALAQLTEEAAAINATLSEFESDAEALDDLLHWLVEGAVRLKALLADTAGGIGVATGSWSIPSGIMPPFPEKSSFGEDLEVTVTVSDSPLSAKTEQVVATPTAASESGGSSTVTSFRPRHTTHTEAAGSGGDKGEGAQPDVSGVLPKDDAMVYGGGVPPPPSSAQPSGGGVGQLLKDALLPPSDADTATHGDTGKTADKPTEGEAEGSEGIIPHLSGVLPSDDALVYGGGVAPSTDAGLAAPSGGGVAQMIKDTLVAPKDTAEDSESTIIPAAPEVASRTSHSYSGAGTGRVEARAADEAAAGLGAGQRRLGRAWSADTPASAVTAAGGTDEVSAEGKELAIVPATPADAPASPADAAATPTTPATATTAAGDAEDSDLNTQRDTPTDTADADSSSSAPAGQAGGIWAKIQRTVADAASAASDSAAAAAARAQQVASAVASAVPAGWHGNDEVTEVTDAAEQEAATGPDTASAATDTTAQHKDTPDVSAWASDDAGSTPPVGLTEPAPADPAPGQPEMPPTMPSAAYPPMSGPGPTAENIKETARRVRGSLSQHSEATGGSAKHGAEAPPHNGPVALPESVVGDPTAAAAGGMADMTKQGEMHIGPEQPPGGPSDPAPGSAIWAQDRTAPPGGAAAGGMGDTTGSKDTEPVTQGQMHIGPEQPPGGPATPAPGSAIWAKGATRPGGAAAAAPAGSPDDDVQPVKDADSSKAGPNLSKILPGYEHGVAEPTANKPEGGSVGTFIKETLLGPSSRS